MKRLLGILFVAGVLVALAIVAGACGGGGDDEQALEEYFQELQRITDDYLARFDTVDDQYQQLVGASESDAVRVPAYFNFLEASSLNIRAEVNARSALDPPSEAEKAHVEWLTAARVLAKLYEDVTDRAPGVQTSSDLQEVLKEVDYEARQAEAEDRARRACSGLQEIADENEIDVNLCPR